MSSMTIGNVPALPAPPAPNHAPHTNKEEVPQKERLHLAYEAWKEAAGSDNPVSARSLALKYGLNPSTLQNRINGAVPAKERDARAQKLNPQEEEALVK